MFSERRTILGILSVTVFSLAVLSLLSSVSAVPFFSQNKTIVFNGSYFPQQSSMIYNQSFTLQGTLLKFSNVSFQINISDLVNGSSTGGWIENITFQLGRPNGQYFNFTMNMSNPSQLTVPGMTFSNSSNI